MLPAAPAPALPEALDTTFGTGGVVTTPIGPTGETDVALAMARQADGKLVLAGNSGDDFALARYNADGSLDTGFSGDGKVVTPMSANESGSTPTDEVRAVLVQPDGKIVVAGFANAIPSSGGLSGDFALARYTDAGALDTSFDTDGKVITEVGTFGGPAFALARQSDGKLVAAGRASSGSTDDFALVRYTDAGALDTTFDTDGKLMTDVGGASQDDEANAVAIQSDGKIVAAGYANPTGGGFEEDFALARYTDTGAPDTSFDGDGKVMTPISTHANFPSDIANAVVLQGDGKIVAAGQARDPTSTANHFGLVRYNGNGSLDTGFDSDGKVTTTIEGSSIAHALAIQGDGKLVAAGSSDVCGFDCNFGLARYNANGSLDTSFDADGKVATGIAPYEQVDIARAVLVDPDGKAVAAGYADMGPPAPSGYLDYDFAIIRHLPNGDNVPPAPPTLSATDPASPGNDESPQIKGSAAAGSTVKLFTNPACSGSPLAQGSAAGFASPGIEVNVASNSTTTFYATATDGSGNTSACSASSVSYVEDSTPPAPPTFTDIDPDSPADDTAPRIKGSAAAGSTVRIYRNQFCLGPPVDEGTAAQFASPGIQVAVADGTTATFYGTATDAVGNTSACSTSSIQYVEQRPATGQPPSGGSTSPFPSFPGGTPPLGEVTSDEPTPPQLAVPSGFAGSASVSRRRVFTVPRTRVDCALDGGVCDVIAQARRGRLLLGTAAFTVEEGDSSRVRIRLSRRAMSVLRRLRRVRAVVQIVVTNLREESVARSVTLTLRAPR